MNRITGAIARQFPHPFATIEDTDLTKLRPPLDLLRRLRDLPEPKPEPPIVFVTMEDVADRVVTMEDGR